MASVLDALRPDLRRQGDCGGAGDSGWQACMRRAKGVVDNYWQRRAEAKILSGSQGQVSFLEEVEICEEDRVNH